MLGLIKTFNWIIISSAAASFIIGIILFIKFIVKDKQSANWHYYIWFIVIARLLMPYAPNSSISVFNTVTPVVEKISISERSLMANTSMNIENINKSTYETNNISKDIGNEKNDIDESNFIYDLSLKKIFAITWIVGIIIFGTYIIFINLRLLWRIKSGSKLSNEYINEVLNECKGKFSIYKDIPVVLTEDVSTPALIGLTRPTLLLSKAILNKISKDELKHIIYHEVAHFKRKDNIINWLIVFIKLLHWFNPVIWYGFYKMREDCEIACDATAMSYMNSKERESYGYTIVHLLEITSRKKKLVGAIGMLSGKSAIKRRIIMISLFNKRFTKFSAVGLGILIILGCILLTNAKENTTYIKNIVQSDDKAVSDSIMKNSITVKEIMSKNFKGKIMTISDPKKITLEYSLDNNKIVKTTSQIAKEESAIAAINAGSFLDNLTPYGFIIKNGNVVYCESRDKGEKLNTVGFDDKGHLIVGKYTFEELEAIGIKDAVNFGPALIVNGSLTKDAIDNNWGIAPRTVIGQKQNGEVVFLVIDGRIAESMGATIKEAAEILLELGVTNAANLDGGSSSTMYYNGNIINHPSNPSGERLVPSAFLVMA